MRFFITHFGWLLLFGSWGWNPIGWVDGLLGKTYRTIADAVRDLVNTVKNFWTILDGLFHAAAGAWGDLRTTVGHWLNDLHSAFADVYGWLHHIWTVTIPDWIAWAVRTAYNAARVLAADVKHWAQVTINTLAHWAQVALHTLEAWARAAVHYLTTSLNEAWSLLRKAAHLVFTLLDKPAHLAAWVAGAIMRPVLRWMLANARGFARWLFRHLIAVTLESVHLIEDVFVSLF